jgi:hypothetical protein
MQVRTDRTCKRLIGPFVLCLGTHLLGRIDAMDLKHVLGDIDHVLQSEDLFEDRSESADLQMLWLLVKAAREFIASLYLREIPAADAANAAKAAVCEFLGTPRVRLRP